MLQVGPRGVAQPVGPPRVAAHGLPHEQRALFDALLAEWLDRVAERRLADSPVAKA